MAPNLNHSQGPSPIWVPSSGSIVLQANPTRLAPEVITRRGYREEVDWWSMGVVIYELLFGKRPFRGRSSKEIASQIIKTSIVFPASRHVSEDCYDFIMKVGSSLNFKWLSFVQRS